MRKWFKRGLLVSVTLVAVFFIVSWFHGLSVIVKDYMFLEREAVQFRSGGIMLSGTLRMPGWVDKPPAMVLIHGSGASPRKDLDWYAANIGLQGYAVLTYDKRGVGESEGEPYEWYYFSFDSLAQDALAGVRFLNSRSDLDTSRIGLFGTSQGGWVAPLAASKASGKIKFMVLVSPTVATVGEDRLFERAERLRREGFSEEDRTEAKELQLLDQAAARDSSNYHQFQSLWYEYQNKPWFQRVYPGDAPAGPSHRWRQWYGQVVDFDPIPYMKDTAIPTAFVFGDPQLDWYGPVRQSMKNIQQLPNQELIKLEQYNGYDHNIGKERFWGLLNKHAAWEDVVFPWLDGMTP